MTNQDPIEAFGWAWVAGLFEGEGCISHDRMKRGTRRALFLGSTDLDVLERLQREVGAGTIRPMVVRGNRKPAWRWGVQNWDDVERISQAILPYLHSRRRAKMLEMLADPVTKGGPNCPNGHPLFGPDADVYKRKGTDRPVCAVCTRGKERARRDARKAAA